MKNYRWLFVIMGVVALGMALTFGAAFGAGISYFFLQAEPVQASFATPMDVEIEEGVLISGVKPESSTAEAGLVRGDIILEINGEPVNSTIEMKEVLAELEPGMVVELTVLHGDDTRILEVELDDAKGIAFLSVGTCDFAKGSKGFPGGPMGDVFIEAFPVGAEIVEVLPESPAETAGLQVGDLIVSVNQIPVGIKGDLAELIQKHEPGDEVILSVIHVDEMNEETATLIESEVTVTLAENPEKPGQAFLGVAYEYGNPMGDFEGGLFPFMEMMPFGEMPEGFEGEGMPKFFFHHGEEFDGELPEGWEEDGEFFFHHDKDMDGGHPEGWGEGEGFYFHEMPNLPEGLDGAVIISEVLDDTPAAQAGLLAGDLIIAIDGEPVEAVEAFVDEMQSRKPGDEVTLTILREDEEIEVQVTLTEHPDDPDKGFLGVLAGSFMMMEEMELPEGFNQDFEIELPGVPGGDA